MKSWVINTFFVSCFIKPGDFGVKERPLKDLLLQVGNEARENEPGEVNFDYEVDEENAK